MVSSLVRPSCLLTILIVASRFLCAADRLPMITVNDNRSPAGELRRGVFTISLELGEGRWHPASEDGEAFRGYAFGERGRSLENPGPLVRVSQGTQIHAIVHNALSVAATVHGLHERPGSDKDAFTVQPGATQDVRFQAGEPGAYYYWASTTGSALERRTPIETQLAGAFIVDPPGLATTDRVFVIGVWYKEVPFRPASPQVATINGKSWPYTERLTFKAGETVHWRWLNPSVSDHAMHLHGFYYHVDGTGDAERYKSYNEAEKPEIVTRFLDTGQTFDMTWLPQRPGRWLFHCHMLIHMSPPEWQMLVEKPEQGAVTTAAHEHSYPAETQHAGMGGLVLGIAVLGGSETAKPVTWHAERKLQLTLDERSGGIRPTYALQLRDLAQPPSPSPEAETSPLIGPPIVLTRGQPVEIELVNRSQQRTAIHWHGIELESYYDGVAGWTGTAEHTTPRSCRGSRSLSGWCHRGPAHLFTTPTGTTRINWKTEFMVRSSCCRPIRNSTSPSTRRFCSAGELSNPSDP